MSARKPYAEDWQQLREGLEYSPRLKLYWYMGQVYDELSARHNGIIGAGAELRRIIKEANKR